MGVATLPGTMIVAPMGTKACLMMTLLPTHSSYLTGMHGPADLDMWNGTPGSCSTFCPGQNVTVADTSILNLIVWVALNPPAGGGGPKGTWGAAHGR